MRNAFALLSLPCPPLALSGGTLTSTGSPMESVSGNQVLPPLLPLAPCCPLILPNRASTHLLLRDVLLKLKVDGLRVGAHDGHADARGGDADLCSVCARSRVCARACVCVFVRHTDACSPLPACCPRSWPSPSPA